MDDMYFNHIKEVCEIVDKEFQSLGFIKGNHDLLSQTVKYKIMSDMCYKVLVNRS
jgi:metallophosphoesterase superfamily enzyme